MTTASIQHRDLAEDIRIVTLSGRLDMLGMDEVALRVTSLTAAVPRRIMVDLTGVSFLASIGIRSIIESARAVRAASEWLVAAGRSLGVPPQPLHRLEVCLNELLANVIEHGGERARSLPVRLDLRSVSVAGPIPPDGRASRDVLQGEATLTLRDGGIRFDPALHTPAGAPARLAEARPGGLGPVMVRQLSDAFSHRRERDQNVVTVRVRWPKPTTGLHGG